MNNSLPDIRRFCEEYLRLRESNIVLTPIQDFTLWGFYINSFCNTDNIDYPIAEPPGAIVTGFDYNSHDPFRSLRLCLGHRSGKDFLLSIIVLYEFFKLVYTNSYAQLKSAPYDIAIIIISGTINESNTLLQEIKSKLLQSNFYSSIQEWVKINTDSIVFSNAYGQKISIQSITKKRAVGINAHTVVFNNAAQNRDFEEAYQTISPVVIPFAEKGNPGKIIVASTPRPGSYFNYLFITPAQHTLCIQSSTWIATPKHTEESLKTSFHDMSEDQFRSEFGAELIESDETEQVTFRLRKSVIDKLKKQARKQAYETDRDVLYTDIIRNVIEQHT